MREAPTIPQREIKSKHRFGAILGLIVIFSLFLSYVSTHSFSSSDDPSENNGKSSESSPPPFLSIKRISSHQERRKRQTSPPPVRLPSADDGVDNSSPQDGRFEGVDESESKESNLDEGKRMRRAKGYEKHRDGLQEVHAETGENSEADRTRRRGFKDNSRLTVVLMSYAQSRRFHLLCRIISTVRRWTSFVEEVVLVWNAELSLLPPCIVALQQEQEGGGFRNDSRDGVWTPASSVSHPLATFKVFPQEHNRVDNRWRIGNLLQTEAVLNLDDDMDLSEHGARCMFDVWRASPMSLIGVDVRSHFHHFARSNVSEGPYGPWGYAARDIAGGQKKYSISLPRALLTNRRHYVTYDALWKNESSNLKRIVDELLCDDIAFNFVAAASLLSHHRTLDMRGMRSTQEQGLSEERGGRSASLLGVPSVIYVKAEYRPFPESHSKEAMFNKPGMKPMRQKCVNRLTRETFGGRMPLQHRSWHVLCSVDG